MPRKPQPPIMIMMDRAQKRPVAAPLTTDGERLVGARDVPLDQVVPDPGQPRRDWIDEEAVADLLDLANSLKEFGVLQPLLVREDGVLDDGRTRYVIIAGGRRRAAAELAELATLPVVIRDEEGARVRSLQLVENIQRRDLSPLDEARAYKEIIDADGISAEALGERLHISGQQIRNRLRLLDDQMLADAVERGQIKPSVAREIDNLPAPYRETIRVRLAKGEAVPLADVRLAQLQAVASGVANPRSKGGGRAARNAKGDLRPASHDQTVFDRVSSPADQTVFDPDPVLGLYEAFKGWEAQVSHLAPHDLQRLVGLIRDDMQSFIASVTEMTSNERDGAIEAVRTGDTL